MATTSLKLGTKTNAEGKSQVVVRVTITRDNRPTFKTGVKVSPNWFKNGVIVPPRLGRLNVTERKEAEDAKSSVDGFALRLEKVCSVLSGEMEKVTREAIEDAMTLTKGMDPKDITYKEIEKAKELREQQEKDESVNKSFFDWFNEFIDKRVVSEGRKRGFKVLVRTMYRYESYLRETDNKDFGWDIHTTDAETVEDFFDYMANEKQLSVEYPETFKKLLISYPAEFTPKHKSQCINDRGRNIIIERKKMLRSFFNWLNSEKVTTNNPARDIEIGTGSFSDVYYLTIAERNKIASTQMGSEHLETQRDIFVFQCLIGARYSDLIELRKDNIVMDDGVLCVQYIPRKTITKNTKPASIPLNARAQELIKKYEGTDVKGRLFPFISNQKYNEAIKDILRKSEIERKVAVIDSLTGKQVIRPIYEIGSSHLARRSFIGCLYEKVHDPCIISSMSGHAEGSRSFARYRNINTKVKNDTIKYLD